MKHGGGHEAGEPADTAERRPLLGQAAGAAALNSSSSGSVCRSGAAAAAAGGEVFVIDVAPPQLQTVPPRPLPRLGSGPLPRVGSGCSSLCSRGGEPRTCRICFETEDPTDGDPANPLISPCLCSGSSRYVHRSCLAQWRESNHRRDAAWQCEVCHFRYRYSRAWWAGLLGSTAALAVVFAALLAALVYGLGYLPVLSSAAARFEVPPPAAALHVANGVVALGVLGLAASVMMGVARACGAVSLLWLPEPWCPTALCLDGGGLPICLDLGAGECAMAMTAVLGVALLVAGLAASAMITWQLLLMGAQAVLSKAQHMVENVQPLLRAASKGSEARGATGPAAGEGDAPQQPPLPSR